MPAPDPDFTRYCTTGDEPAFRTLVTAHVPMVLGVAARKLGPHAHLAPDVAQAVFTRLARVARGLPRDLIVAPWLHRQAVRLAIDAVRKEERRLRRETTAAMLHAPDSTTPTAETALLVDEALDQLPAADRTVLVLRYLEDRDYESVARSLNSTPEAARKRIARSLEKLRALLTRRGVALSTAALTGFLTGQSSQAAPAALTARISASALKSAAATGNTAAILTTALMSHATALTTGALAALLACGLFYQQREKEIAQSAARSLLVQAERSHMSHRPDKSHATDSPVPGTLPEIIDALVKITVGPDTTLARERIIRLLRLVPPEQYLEFYVSAENQVHPLRWLAVVGASVDEWQKRDPASLTRALFDSDNRKEAQIRLAGLQRDVVFNSFQTESGREGGWELRPTVVYAYQAWRKVDPAAADQWLESVKQSPLNPLSRPFGGGHLHADLFAAYDPSRSPIHPGRLGDLSFDGLPPQHAALRRCIWARQVLGAADYREAVFQSGTTSSEVRTLTNEHAERHADECRQLIADGSAPRELRLAAALGMVESHEEWSAGSPRILDFAERIERAQLALELADTLPARAALKEVVQAWFADAHVNGESELPGWLLAKGGPDAADALAAGALRLAELNCDQHSLSWATAVPDAAQRGPLLRGIYQRWQDADPAAAQKFLSTAPPGLAAQLPPPASATP